MTALVVLGILGVTALFLAGALTYLYRWRVRKKLFPQLPRLWKGDRNRFLASTGLFVVSLLAFMVVSLITGPSLPEPPSRWRPRKLRGHRLTARHLRRCRLLKSRKRPRCPRQRLLPLLTPLQTRL
jgi:hypothetical protein